MFLSMCGIVGIFNSAGHVDESAQAAVAAMAQSIRQRGPDDQGIWRDDKGQVTLGHRRLAILDRSSAGHQPMSTADGRFVIVFNGEIYNYLQLRDELQLLGHTFVSNTDTEVLLAGYAQWGAEVLQKLRGMFAFAVWNSRPTDEHPRLFLARDRLGIKPLLYARGQSGQWIFASQLKAILVSGMIARKLDMQSVWDYLALGAVVQPRTMVEGVTFLPPGHFMCVNDDGSSRSACYWDLKEAVLARRATLGQITPEQAQRLVREALDEATDLHLISDVPVGAFLSGGIDSTVIVGMMSKRVSEPIHTYVMGFDPADVPRDERKWAAMAAEQFGAAHRELILKADDVVAKYDAFIEALDQPSHDGLNTWFISAAARQSVGVALSGLGGDELFGGYPHFEKIIRGEKRSLRQRVSQTLRGQNWSPSVTEQGRFDYPRLRIMADDTQRMVMASDGLKQAMSHRKVSDVYAGWLDHSELDSFTELSIVELHGYLLNTLLRDVDVLSMSHSLEVRPIFLDHPLVELALALPAALKVDEQRTKKVLVDATRDILPEAIVDRVKEGFSLPLADWLAGPLRDKAMEALDSPAAELIFEPAYILKLKADIRRHRCDGRHWAYIVLLRWVNQQGLSC